MAYPFHDIEKEWQEYWAKSKTFRAENNSRKPKYYVLDMFPYPSGAGLHVGHPLGYIASDIVSRYKRLKGFNVLHPMGYDSFGLPAEQYAIQNDQHPAITTENNIARYRKQMDKIGFSFDWDREVRTSDPEFYKWTQWIFLKLFHSWYNPETDKAEPIEKLIQKFQSQKSKVNTGTTEKLWDECSEKEKSDVLMNYRLAYLSEAWVNWCPQLGTVLANEEVKDGVSERGGYPVERKLMPQWSLRITAYAERLLNDLDKIDWSESIKESQRNWIGKSKGSSLQFRIQNSSLLIEVFTTRPDTIFGTTFLALAPESDLVPFLTTTEQKQKVEAYIRYAKSRSERDRQSEVKKVTGEFTGSFAIHPFTGEKLPVWIAEYVLAGYGTGAVMGVPAHDTRDHAFAKHFGLPIKQVITVPNGWDIQKESWDRKEGKVMNSDFINGLKVEDAIKKIISEIEKRNLGKGKTQYRLRDAIFGRQRYWGEPIPIYYENEIPKPVDEKDLPVVLPEVDKYLPTETGEPPLARAKNWKYKGKYEFEKTTMPGWAGSSWYYLRYMDAKNEKEFVSQDAVNYWQNVDLYIGGAEHATGHLLYVRFWTKFLHDLGYLPFDEPVKKLINQGMIQGVSQYYYEIRVRADIKEQFDKKDKILRIKKNNKILFEINVPKRDDWSGYNIYCNNQCKLEFVFVDVLTKREIPTVITDGHSTANFVKEVSINGEAKFAHTLLEKWLRIEPHYRPIIITDFPYNAYWHYENKEWRDFSNKKVNQDEPLWLLRPEIEKMSKSRLNVVTPDNYDYPILERDKNHFEYYFSGEDLQKVKTERTEYGVIEKYGADTLRMYEMFLGPLEMSKPWNTNGIAGVFNFLNRFWKLFPQEQEVKSQKSKEEFQITDEEPSKQELKILHKTIKKIQQDIENYSFNTAVSSFMICVNELTKLKCRKRKILEPLVILLSPFAPHLAEELWKKLDHQESISFASFPEYEDAFTMDESFAYPVSFNGKMRFNIELSLSLSPSEIEKEVLAYEQTQKYLRGKIPKKIIVVPKKIVNIVVD